ncbi:MAG: fimbrillin family protein [Bacteroidales bacterium]|nr:fimbrillin family protein [Bacteroidales bacterium]
MKKNYFMLAAAALMFAACAETDFVNPVPVNEGEAIGFETFANLPTKATTNPENSTVTTFNDLSTHHKTFKVWGYKNVATDYVFDGVVITHDGSWNYQNASDKKYWDKAATTYEFYAAAPNIAGWELQEKTAAQDDNYFTIDNVELKDETLASTSFVESLAGLTSNKDLMIANPNSVDQGEFGNNVQFEFYHILSRLNITVKKESTLTDDVVLTYISVKDLLNIANFDESKTITTAGSTERWTKTANKGNLTGNALAEVSDEAKHVLQSLVIPQNVAYQKVNRDGSTVETAPYLYIEYTINGEPFNATYNLANAFGLIADGNIPFNEGWQNNLNITIDAAEIKFAANAFVWKSSDKGFGIE